MANSTLIKTQRTLEEFQAVTEHEWAMTPALWDTVKRFVKKLPAELEPELVRLFYAKVFEFGTFPLFSAEMPANFFPVYAQLRIERAKTAIGQDISEDFVSETAFLFNCHNDGEMRSFAHATFDEDGRLCFLLRQRLVECHKRYTSIPNFKIEQFKPLAQESVILEAAQNMLANNWFLAACQRVQRSETSDYRFDVKLWAACKLVLLLAGETVCAPGPEPKPLVG